MAKKKNKKNNLSLKNSLFSNWKIMLPVLLISAVIGGYFVQIASAGGYVFVNKASNMALNFPYTKTPARIHSDRKIDGVVYKIHTNESRSYSEPYTFVTASQASRSKRLCAHFKVIQLGKPLSSGHHVAITYRQNNPRRQYGSAMSISYRQGSSGWLCLDARNINKAGTLGLSSDAHHITIIGVDSLYGVASTGNLKSW